MRTPVSEKAFEEFRTMSAFDAAVRAWNDSGSHPSWHRTAQEEVRRWMPLLADALDRLGESKVVALSYSTCRYCDGLYAPGEADR